MRITELDISGFKGQYIRLGLTGRDLVRAPNMAGKTAIRQSIEFMANGVPEGLKREDLIDYAPTGEFYVSMRTDSGVLVKRVFTVLKGGKTKIDLEFEPAGLEETLADKTERLYLEFEDAPLVTFDLTKFLTGDDSYRLESCQIGRASCRERV